WIRESCVLFFFQAADGIRGRNVTGVQTCALPISLGNGRQWWPWIHLEDWVRAAIFLLEGELEGPVNLTAPNPATNREITRQIAQIGRASCRERAERSRGGVA